MATDDTLEELMKIVECFFSGETGEQYSGEMQKMMDDEPGTSLSSLEKIPREEFLNISEVTPPDPCLQMDDPRSSNNEVPREKEPGPSRRLTPPNAVSISIPSVSACPFPNRPYVLIIVQPAPCSLRFRYECEIQWRSAGSIVGVGSNFPDVRTFPTIMVINYQGPFIVVVSCVTKEGPPYWPHPHNLVGKECCKRGICSVIVHKSPDMTCSFTGLGIQCVKIRDIEKTLKLRQKHNHDPFNTGFNYPGTYDLSVVRLCFQVFIPSTNGGCPIPLEPVVSDPIYDKKAVSNLTIVKLSHCSAPASGGTEVILLCDKVSKDDIQIWFYEEPEGTWETQAEFQTTDVHKQVAISFRTPPYRFQNIQEPVTVLVELRKPREDSRGEPREFTFLPVERDPEGIAHKKRKMIEKKIEEYCKIGIIPAPSVPQEQQVPICVPRTRRQPNLQRIRAQPRVGLNTNEDHFSQPSTSFAEYPDSTTLSTVSIGGPSTSFHETPAHTPDLVTSSDDRTSIIPPLTSSSMLQQVIQQAESPDSNNLNEILGAQEDAIIERFDSLDLDENLSASLFDSTLYIADSTYQDNNPSANDQQQ